MAVRVLWALVLGFLLGVFLRSLGYADSPGAGVLLLTAFALILYALIVREKKDTLVVIAVLLIASASGITRMESALRIEDPVLSTYADTSVTVEGVVVMEPDAREASTRLTLDTDALLAGEERLAVDAKLIVVAPVHAPAAYGDRVRAEGRLEVPAAFDTGASHSFDYRTYLAKDGILYTLSFASVEVIGETRANVAKRFALDVKHVLLTGLHRALPEPEAGLAAGITLGEKRAAGEELSEAFIRTSLIHIVVLSGYNITVVINAAARVLEWLPRAARFGVSAVVVVFFILMTGGAATAVRAGIMAYLAVYARLTGRRFVALRVLALTAFLMVAWNPWTLVYDPSFQLSVLATLGLILYTPLYARRLRFLPERMGVREIAASTLATQTAVLPLLLYQSGNLSLVGLPANVLALIAIPHTMAFSMLAALGGILFGPAAPFFGLPAHALLAYVVYVAQFFASLPLASLTVPAFSGWLLIVFYAALALPLCMQKRNATEQL